MTELFRNSKYFFILAILTKQSKYASSCISYIYKVRNIHNTSFYMFNAVSYAADMSLISFLPQSFQ